MLSDYGRMTVSTPQRYGRLVRQPKEERTTVSRVAGFNTSKVRPSRATVEMDPVEVKPDEFQHLKGTAVSCDMNQLVSTKWGTIVSTPQRYGRLVRRCSYNSK